MTQPLSDRELRELLKGTPAPWRLTDEGVAAGRLRVRISHRGADHAHAVADARLISAASALAEEVLRLRDALRMIEMQLDDALKNTHIKGVRTRRWIEVTLKRARAALQEES